MKTTALFQLIKLLPVFIVGLFFFSCQKDIDEPKHKNKGKNVIYMKFDDQEFLIKEGFSLRRDVIRADIIGQGNKGDNNPTYYEGEYFGKKFLFLSINHFKKTTSDYFGRGIWDISVYEDDSGVAGIPNGITLNFFSEKHQRWITFDTQGHGWPGEFCPQIKILKHDKKKETISLTYKTEYFDKLDSTIRGKLYIYFDVEYDKL